jgi:shikimate 5-dehydrogenase
MICGSLSKKAGTFGRRVHTRAASYYKLDFCYYSFSVDDISQAITAIKTLKFRGVGVSMPYKKKVLDCVDVLTPEVRSIGAANTIINEDGKLIAYNTDWLAAKEMLALTQQQEVVILGRGGLACAVAFAAQKLDMKYRFIDRTNWSEIPYDKLVFNCTPVADLKINNFIDCLVGTKTGNELALKQAGRQFELYTGEPFPYDLVY